MFSEDTEKRDMLRITQLEMGVMSSSKWKDQMAVIDVCCASS